MMEEKQKAQIDIAAEKTLFSPSLDVDDQKISLVVNDATAVKLPESIIYEPTKIEVSEKPQVQTANVSMDLRIKFDPELEVKNLTQTVDDMQQTLSQAVNSIQSRWIPDPKAASDFEERPTLEQTNLIFDARKEEFSQYPEWA